MLIVVILRAKSWKSFYTVERFLISTALKQPYSIWIKFTNTRTIILPVKTHIADILVQGKTFGQEKKKEDWKRKIWRC